jgi:phosphatidylserine decarboxylase
MGEVWRSGRYVVKSHPRPPEGLFEAEATGLRALGAAGARVPEVFWAGHDGIVIEWLPGEPDAHGLAATVAAIHRARGERYGWEGPVFLGRFELPSGWADDWRTFWAARRIQPLLRSTWTQLGALGPRCERLLATVQPPQEGPVLLHGDLWAGNAHGRAVIDPSCWYGERGVDLAMMKLFGGFDAAFWSAYEDRLPVPAAVWAAVPFYQLYYVLVHVHFFGAGYLADVERCLRG